MMTLFTEALVRLTVHSDVQEMNKLVSFAGSNVRYGKPIAAAISSSILKGKVPSKLPMLCLLDRIVKGLGGVYIDYFAPNLEQAFVVTYNAVDDEIQRGLRNMLASWEGIFPGHIIEGIEENLRQLQELRRQRSLHGSQLETGQMASQQQPALFPKPPNAPHASKEFMAGGVADRRGSAWPSSQAQLRHPEVKEEPLYEEDDLAAGLGREATGGERMFLPHGGLLRPPRAPDGGGRSSSRWQQPTSSSSDQQMIPDPFVQLVQPKIEGGQDLKEAMELALSADLPPTPPPAQFLLQMPPGGDSWFDLDDMDNRKPQTPFERLALGACANAGPFAQMPQLRHLQHRTGQEETHSSSAHRIPPPLGSLRQRTEVSLSGSSARRGFADTRHHSLQSGSFSSRDDPSLSTCMEDTGSSPRLLTGSIAAFDSARFVSPGTVHPLHEHHGLLHPAAGTMLPGGGATGGGDMWLDLGGFVRDEEGGSEGGNLSDMNELGDDEGGGQGPNDDDDDDEDDLEEDDETGGVLRPCHISGCFTPAVGHSNFCRPHGGTRTCTKEGCDRSAQGSTSLCIAHGGGKRCQRGECRKGAIGNTGLCMRHGGGKRCEYQPWCDKGAIGSTRFCTRHGGGKRCVKKGCNKSAKGNSNLCISHGGGGRRCQHPGCEKIAEGRTSLCKGHGGGKRCQHPACDKSAQGSTLYCSGHGGGRRCQFPGCNKGGMRSWRDGHSFYCIKHGGGKKCQSKTEDCSKSAQGGSLYCLKHGGGKRCQMDGCNNSVRWKSTYCLNHGGGKRGARQAQLLAAKEAMKRGDALPTFGLPDSAAGFPPQPPPPLVNPTGGSPFYLDYPWPPLDDPGDPSYDPQPHPARGATGGAKAGPHFLLDDVGGEGPDDPAAGFLPDLVD